jgi:hypothetical protein
MERLKTTRNNQRPFWAAICVAALSAIAFAQNAPRPFDSVLKGERPLTPREVLDLLAAVRKELNGKVYHLQYGGGDSGAYVKMGADGRPRVLRMTSGSDRYSGVVGGADGTDRVVRQSHADALNLVQYTGVQAQSCRGTPLGQELVVEYNRPLAGGAWQSEARTRTDHEFGEPIFEMLSSAISMADGGRQEIAARTARRLVAVGRQANEPDGPTSGSQRSLWIDIERMSPIQWSMSLPEVRAQSVGVNPAMVITFARDETVDLKLPSAATPGCIP